MTLRRMHQRGFALVETIVAFMVLAIGMAAIGSSIALAMRSDARLEARRGALQLARSRLEQAGIVETLVPGRQTGLGAGNRVWSETVTSLPTAQSATAPSTLRAFWVEVSVQTGDGGYATLAALKLVTADQR